MKARFSLLLSVFLICAPVALHAEIDPSEAAEAAILELEAAATALANAQSASDRIAALTQTIKGYEHGLLTLREAVRRAALAQRAIESRLDTESAELSGLLMAMQRIAAEPSPVGLMHPNGPVASARAGMVLADVTPALAAEAIALRQELEQIATLSRLQSGAVLQMEAALSEVQTARASLAAAVAERREAPDRFALSEDALRQIVEAVDTLDAFLDLLAQAPAPEDSAMRGFSDARSAVPLPVFGVLLSGFEAQDAAGISRPGLLLATAPAALVTSPWFGTVRYAGPLLDYGNVVILEPEGNILMILAGLGDLYVTAGTVIAQGAPLGMMPSAAGARADLITETPDQTGAALSETIYIELRQDGSAIDPQPWFDWE